MKKLVVLTVMAMLAGFALGGTGFAQTPFYQGKTINVVYGGGPGGTVDLRFRATAAVLRKHIPGRPTFVIEYMPGGGSRKAGNFIYRARPDGLTMGVMLSSFVPAAVLGLSGVLYDIDKLHYLGSPTSGEPYIFVTRKEARLDSIEKLRNATGVRIGAQSVGHNLYNIGRISACARHEGAEVHYRIRPRRRSQPGHDARRARRSMDHPGNASATSARVDREEAGGLSSGPRGSERAKTPSSRLCAAARYRTIDEIGKGAKASCHAKGLCQRGNSFPPSSRNVTR